MKSCKPLYVQEHPFLEREKQGSFDNNFQRTYCITDREVGQASRHKIPYSPNISPNYTDGPMKDMTKQKTCFSHISWTILAIP